MTHQRGLLGTVSIQIDQPLPLPTRLSPSRAGDFVQCPKLFYYKTILGRSTPQTAATAKGTLAHLVLERLFDHEREDRTLEVALAYVKPGWETMVRPLKERGAVLPDSLEAALRDREGLWRDDVDRDSSKEERLQTQAEQYEAVAPRDSKQEANLLEETTAVITNYFVAEVERPWNFDPEAREQHLEATVGNVTLHGFIDRLDRYTTSDGEVRWVISDYKTGKVPKAQYLDKSFFAMKVYALLLTESDAEKKPFSLRLVFVGAPKHESVKVLQVDDKLLESTLRTMNRLWDEISQSYNEDVWETKKGPLCNWCHFQAECPAFR